MRIAKNEFHCSYSELRNRATNHDIELLLAEYELAAEERAAKEGKATRRLDGKPRKKHQSKR